MDRSPRRRSAAKISIDDGGRKRNGQELRLAVRLAKAASPLGSFLQSHSTVS
jgi:hypothetical protein